MQFNLTPMLIRQLCIDVLPLVYNALESEHAIVSVSSYILLVSVGINGFEGSGEST
jgi:hypothetical protein